MIETIIGPVKAGKSKKLIEDYESLKPASSMVFSSKYSLTQGEDVVSRYGTKLKAIPINSLYDIPLHINSQDVEYILVDEFQFLEMSIDELKSFFDEYYPKYHFKLYGLPDDYTKKPFLLMAYAMAMSDEITMLNGYCDICKKEKSRYSLRLCDEKPADIKSDAPVVLLDGEHNQTKVEYLSVCPKCYCEIYYPESGK